MGRRAKLLIAASTTLLGVTSAAWWGPRLIAPKLLAAVEDLAADQLRGRLTLGTASVSALRDFPRLTLTIDDVSLTGEGDFFPDEEILAAKRLEATLDLWSAVQGEYVVEALAVRGGQVSLHIAEDGTASWDVFEPTPATDSTAEEAAPVVMDISALTLDDVSVAYLDVPGATTGMVEGLSGTGALRLDGDDLLVTLAGGSSSVSFAQGELSYINQGTVSLDATLRSDLAGGTYTFAKNQLQINALPLVLDGTIGFVEDGLDLNLRFDAPEASFKDLLSAVPAVYAREYETIDASGSIALKGAITGRSTEALVPGLELAISVADGRFRYPGLPSEVSDIQVDATVSSPEGPNMDALAVDIRKLSGSLAGQPFDVRMRISDTQTDPYLNGAVKLDLDLGRLGEFIPLSDGESYTGRVRADVQMRGRNSDIAAGRYTEVAASGPIELTDFRYDSPDFPHPIEISRGDMELIPEGLRVSQLQARTGGSDAAVVGQIDDLMGYLFAEAPLKGTLRVQSQRVDMADFSEEAEEAEETEAASGAVVVPEGYALTIDLDADEVIYDDITLSSLSGRVAVADQRATLSSMTARAFGGKLEIDGSYTARTSQPPVMDFTVAMLSLDVPEVAGQLDLATAMTPLVSSARGAFSAELSLKGRLDEAMSPVMDSLTSAGVLSAQQLTFNKTPLFTGLADVTGLPALSDVAVRKLKMRYDLDGGQIQIKPTDFQLGEIPATLSGSQGLDQRLDLTLQLALPTSSAKVRSLVGDLLSDTLPDTIPVAIAIGGTLSAPKFSLSLAATKEQLLSGLEDTAREAVSDAAQALLDEANVRAEAIIDAARAAADAVLSEANQQADALVKAAKGSVAKSLAEKAADALKKEARKRAKQLINKAEQQAQKILDEAAAKAEAL